MIDLDRVTRVLSPRQIRSIVECQHARVSIWCGAVRSGKTVASLLAFLFGVASAPDTGLLLVVGRTLQTIERNIIDPLQSSALFGPIAKHVHHTTGSTTAIILGRVVHLVGASDARAEGRIRGATAALAYVDEATLVPETFWTMLLSRLSVPGARLLATTNPDGPAHWLRKGYLLRAGELDLASWHFTLDDNPSLDPRYVTSLKAEYVGLWYRRFILGEWCLAQGAVYDMWDDERHVVDEVPAIVRWIGAGLDYGTTNPFAALLLGLGEDGRLYLTSEYRHDSALAFRSLTDPEYSENVRTWLANVEQPGRDTRGVRPEWIYVDPSAASFGLQLYRDGVNNVADAINDVLPGIRTVSGLLARDALKVHRSCTGLINEIPGYSWDDSAAQKGEDKPIKANDHSLDAARYVLHSSEYAWRHLLAPEVST